MANESPVLRQRGKPDVLTDNDHDVHTPPPIRDQGLKQYVLMLGFFLYFTSACVIVHISQLLVLPLYWINKDYYYAYITLTKQAFGLIVNAIMKWFNPTLMRVSGDESIKGELHLTKDGRLETDFPQRLILISNHQIYTDWLYLWWVGYAGRMHGHIFIILKESLKYIPVLGPAMLYYGFVFLARNWAKDQPRLREGMKKLKTRHSGPMSGHQGLDPMWLMLFPEGTNLSKNGRAASKKWADKTGLQDMRHCLLPRSTGSFFVLNELKDTVDWIYDCTMAYEGIPRGEYGQDVFQLRSMFFQGQNPRSVNLHWRKIPISSLPLDNAAAFDTWLRDWWREKDDLLEYYAQNGRFPASKSAIVPPKGFSTPQTEAGFIETYVGCKFDWEPFLVYLPLLAEIPLYWGVRRLYHAIC